MARRDRFSDPRRDDSAAFDETARARWVLTSTRPPIVYEADWSRVGVVANDAAPNAVEPPDGRVIPAANRPLGALGVSVVVTAATDIEVWRKTGLTAAGLRWTRIAAWTLGAADSMVEQFVETGWNDVFVRIASGAGVPTPVAVHVGGA